MPGLIRHRRTWSCHGSSAMRSCPRFLLGLVALLALHAALAGAQPDLSEYRTVDQAIPAKPPDTDGLLVEQIAAGSPAEKADLKVGDVLLKLDNVVLIGADKLSELITARKPGDVVTLTLGPTAKPVEKKVVLAAEQVTEARPG